MTGVVMTPEQASSEYRVPLSKVLLGMEMGALLPIRLGTEVLLQRREVLAWASSLGTSQKNL